MNQEIDYQILEDFLNNSSIPVINTPPKTFLEIARQPHYENVISNIYAFFLNPEEEHGLGHLFVNSILELVDPDNKKNNFEHFVDYSIETEFSTDKNGRIDILIHNDSNAIIIENKIYHHLNNDLNDYWTTISNNSRSNENIIGIVLTLGNEHVKPETQFINLRHIDILKKVFDDLGQHLMDADPKYIVFLKDFYQNIINLSEKTMKKEDIQFFVNHQEKVNQVIQLNDSVQNHIRSEVEKAVNMIEGFDLYPLRGGSGLERRLRYYTSKKVNELVITVLFEDLLSSEKKLYLYIEVWGKDTISQLKKISRENANEFNSKLIHADFQSNENDWAHFASKEFPLSTDEIYDLSNFISQALNDTELMNLFRLIENKVTKKKINT